MAEFERSAGELTAPYLAQRIEAETVLEGDILWQAGEFFVANAPYRRVKTTTAEVQPLRKGAVKKFKGHMLVPIVRLLTANQGIDNRALRRRLCLRKN